MWLRCAENLRQGFLPCTKRIL
uniref:Uncharacterized protein n=1 Tax=Arundo donax TaxID=35708 RepID=A0A0A9B4W6_ARUDO